MSTSLDFSEHVKEVVRKASLLCNWIMRTFVVKLPEVYVKMYKSHVMPVITYGCIIWNPVKMKDIKSLERIQSKFIRRVEARCNLDKGSVLLPNIMDVLRAYDVKYFRKLVKRETMFDELFELRTTSTRRRFVISAKETACTSTVNHLYPWRMVSMINCDD